MDRKIRIFTGTAQPQLATEVSRQLGIMLGSAAVGRFSDGEVCVEILENVRGMDTFVLQSTCPPANDSLMEVMLLIDALRRASAGRITAAIPYIGYSRQDRRARSARVPISAKVVANMLTSVGVDRILTMDVHADQIQGFFDLPVDNIYATPVFLNHIQSKNYEKKVVISPDVGSVVRARVIAKYLHCDLAIIDKRRPKHNVAEVMNIIGDIEGKTCIMMDDLVDTANTLCKGAEALKAKGTKAIVAYCTHPILSGDAINKINHSPIDHMIVTDTVPLGQKALASPKIQQLSIAQLLANTISCISSGSSVSRLFEGY